MSLTRGATAVNAEMDYVRRGCGAAARLPGLLLVGHVGIWQVLGAVVLLVPRVPRLKDWAYARRGSTSTGAVASSLAVALARWAQPVQERS